MCGVLGLSREHVHESLGQVAGLLLQTLEYRGYDSSGAVLQGATADDVVLLKGVGAPSELIHSLGIVNRGGRSFCGQVRWATFGAVDDINAQPHVVRCHTFLYGAHNGNVTNTDSLKRWLTAEGHTVVSDNDGEMVVHAVEHFFAAELRSGTPRRLALRQAVKAACKKLEGSFAAVVVDPETQTFCCIKRGSSLYFGVGTDEAGRFALASSDLSAVLKRTKMVLPLLAGEYVIYDYASYEHRRLDDDSDTLIERTPRRSVLRVQDTALLAPYKTFMEQEIAAQPDTIRDVMRMYEGGSARARAVTSLLQDKEAFASLHTAMHVLEAAQDEAGLRSAVATLASHPLVRSAEGALAKEPDACVSDFRSSLRSALEDGLAAMPEAFQSLMAIDALFERHETAAQRDALLHAADLIATARAGGHHVYFVSCGTSFHAAKTATLFFAELAGLDVSVVLPGEFRGTGMKTWTSDDVLVAISQSGETKDLVDVLAAVPTGLQRIAFVNNMASTIAQELGDVVIPLRCGPEIAVPATKSFLNQLTVLYLVAHEVGKKTQPSKTRPIPDFASLVERTLATLGKDLEQAAEALYLRPSMHILATKMLGVAKEGALKIREVVLNHTEGVEAAEFKHGPNTILGFNTLFGMDQVQALLESVANTKVQSLEELRSEIRTAVATHTSALYADYPLIFVTGPERRDVDVTISQIHTHKIRGASVILVAEEDERLREAGLKAPMGADDYKAAYLTLPATGDTLQTAFSASVALQRLALRMSEKKMQYLDGLHIKDHGVHPDVPKNVSKSITVD